MQIPGFWELLLIAGVALLVFGPRRLPEMGQSLGRGIREFRKALRDVGEEAASVDPPTAQHKIGDGSAAAGSDPDEPDKRW